MLPDLPAAALVEVATGIGLVTVTAIGKCSTKGRWFGPRMGGLVWVAGAPLVLAARTVYGDGVLVSSRGFIALATLAVIAACGRPPNSTEPRLGCREELPGLDRRSRLEHGGGIRVRVTRGVVQLFGDRLLTGGGVGAEPDRPAPEVGHRHIEYTGDRRHDSRPRCGAAAVAQRYEVSGVHGDALIGDGPRQRLGCPPAAPGYRSVSKQGVEA